MNHFKNYYYYYKIIIFIFKIHSVCLLEVFSGWLDFKNKYKIKGFKMINTRLALALKTIGLKQTNLADKLLISVHDIRNMASRKKKITPKFALLLEDKFNINPVWLIFGRGEMIEKTEKTIKVSSIFNQNNSRVCMLELEKRITALENK